MIRYQHNQGDLARLWWWNGRYALMRHLIMPLNRHRFLPEHRGGFFGGFHAQAVDGEEYMFAAQQTPPQWPAGPLQGGLPQTCQLPAHLFRVINDELYAAYPDHHPAMMILRQDDMTWDEFEPYGAGMRRVPGYFQHPVLFHYNTAMVCGEADARVAVDGRFYPTSRTKRRGVPPKVFDASHRYHVAVQPDGRQIRVAHNGPTTFVLGFNYLAGVTSIAISPDQERLLATAPDGVTVFSLPGMVKQAEYALPGNHTSLWAPDGLTFAVADKYTVTVMDA